MRSIPMTALVLALIPGGLSAQALDDGRFRLEKTPEGFVRLDTRTGALSLCQARDGALVCRMAADERAAYEEDLDRLEKRVTALELKAGATPAPGAGLTAPPSDEEIDRSIGIMERFMRSFMGIIEEFEGRKQGAEPLPDRS